MDSKELELELLPELFTFWSQIPGNYLTYRSVQM